MKLCPRPFGKRLPIQKNGGAGCRDLLAPRGVAGDDGLELRVALHAGGAVQLRRLKSALEE